MEVRPEQAPSGLQRVFSLVCHRLVAADFPPLKTELILNTHTIVTDIRQDVSRIREDAGNPNQAVSDTHTFYHFPAHSCCLDSEQVSNSDC